MATTQDYNAAAAAMSAMANQMIASLPWFEEAPAKSFVTPALLHKFAVAAVDAVDNERKSHG